VEAVSASTKQPAAAVDGYRRLIAIYNLPAIMGLGNSYYALGDLKNSEAAFRQATEAHPREGAAWNNLADVLFRQGQKSEALDAARKAIALGGPLADTFQKTFEEIKAAAP
jgi:tetratricopeptide (TPR) repeat protein